MTSDEIFVIGLLIVVGVGIAALCVWSMKNDREEKARLAKEVADEAARVASLTPEELAAETAKLEAAQEASRVKLQEERVTDFYGVLNPVMLCPHCAEKGHIHTKRVEAKKGISGGKATAAVLTAGVSVIATGLSRKEVETQAYCGNCKNNWTF